MHSRVGFAVKHMGIATVRGEFTEFEGKLEVGEDLTSANARGVMQVMPGTWDYVQRFLAPGRALNPTSAADNVTAGVLYLKSLLQQTGGNEGQAIAAYYQGLGALRSRGVLPETAHYVANVEALRSRFGG